MQTVDRPGRHADGGGLYLIVDPSGAKRWVMLYRFGGKRREMGFGSVAAVPLAKAREFAAKAREELAARRDPIEIKRAAPADAAVPTFGEIAKAYMDDRAKVWRNDIHKRQWRQTLEVHAAKIWAKPVSEIGTEDVLLALRPLWASKSETARRLRGRLERVLDAAAAGDHRSGPNPARWVGHLAMLLPKPRKLTRGHHRAMPYVELPAFIAALRTRPGRAARALEFLILTASRSGEVRCMLREEINGNVWTVPATRMKSKREHRVPLTKRALDILADQDADILVKRSLVFPGPRTCRPSSDMVFAALLRRMGRADVTTHGFRSSFRDWVSEETDFPSELAEAALAHLVGDETERAYRRGDALEKRRHLMEVWSTFLGSAIGADAKKDSSVE